MTEHKLNQIYLLNKIAEKRGQTLTQMAVSWLLQDKRVTSVIIGASSVTQLADNVKAVDKIDFSSDEIQEINAISLNK